MIRHADRVSTWIKQCPTPLAAEREAAGLAWLARADRGPRVVTVHALDGRRLVLERIHAGRTNPSAAFTFGAALANLHAAGAPWWGAPPPGASGDGTIGRAVLATPPAPTPAAAGPRSWGEFYATYRVLPHLRGAVGRGAITTAQARQVHRLAEALREGRFDHPQPALVPGPVARLHGDLWGGNVLWDPDGRAVLIDPAAHGGHAETDLAMLALFSASHLADILAGYQSVSPLASGWDERVALHQLHPLLVHAELFGADYGEAAVAVARRYVESGLAG